MMKPPVANCGKAVPDAVATLSAPPGVNDVVNAVRPDTLYDKTQPSASPAVLVHGLGSPSNTLKKM
jgi:hypothetical protein